MTPFGTVISTDQESDPQNEEQVMILRKHNSSTDF